MTDITNTFFLTHETQLIDVIISSDSVEVIYLEKPTINYWPNLNNNHPKIFKYVFTVEDNKLKKSEKIYGNYYPSQEWSYNFD